MNNQEKIARIYDSLKEMQLEKNKRYGDSALKPNNIFSKLDSESSIKIRLDDKLGRIANSDELNVNDISDIVGYLVLLLISIDANEKDILNLID